ncbi:unnamed protein product [Dovyalis caffra]|uniref:Uncharacterized protein n=1 Tax=Dovyalis caffra TaxID=77055 RepID=A0AAV1RGF3_9ROSI|nr:unnamed protein product [Dovyalis caffra]
MKIPGICPLPMELSNKNYRLPFPNTDTFLGSFTGIGYFYSSFTRPGGLDLAKDNNKCSEVKSLALGLEPKGSKQCSYRCQTGQSNIPNLRETKDFMKQPQPPRKHAKCHKLALKS